MDAIYCPESKNKKPDWFNGFIQIEKHHKTKYNWGRYVYLPQYYTEVAHQVVSEEKIQARFGTIKPQENCIDARLSEYYETTHTPHFGTGNKVQIAGTILGTVNIYNIAAKQFKRHRYLFANNDYIIRQLNGYDRQQIKDILQICSKELGRFFQMAEFSILLNDGMLLGCFNKDGEMHGIQAFSFLQGEVSPEPLTYIDPRCRGQGIFHIFNDAVIELGKAIGAEYIYAHCLTENDKMRQVYESVGYIKQPGTRLVGKSNIQELYMFKYPLKTSQRSFF